MADTPDPQELARRYIDLWQQHLTQAATDPELAAAMANFWQNLPAGMAPGIPGWPPITANNSAADNDPGADATPGSAPKSAAGSPSAPASSVGGGDDLDELLNRMAALEKRLDAMERKPRSGGKRAAKGSGKRKS